MTFFIFLLAKGKLAVRRRGTSESDGSQISDQQIQFNSLKIDNILFFCFHVKISEEFQRITSKDLLGTFNASLDKLVPGLLKLYRSKKGAFGQKMEDLLDELDDQVSEVPFSLAVLEEIHTFLLGMTTLQ